MRLLWSLPLALIPTALAALLLSVLQLTEHLGVVFFAVMYVAWVVLTVHWLRTRPV